MYFDNWKWQDCRKTISRTILWEYDTDSPDWDWNGKATIVVRRILELGLPDDYLAMFRLYGGPEGVARIIRRIPSLDKRIISFVCIAFGLKKEELRCCQKTSSMPRPSTPWNG